VAGGRPLAGDVEYDVVSGFSRTSVHLHVPRRRGDAESDNLEAGLQTAWNEDPGAAFLGAPLSSEDFPCLSK